MPIKYLLKYILNTMHVSQFKSIIWRKKNSRFRKYRLMDCKFCEIAEKLIILVQFSESTWFTGDHSISNSDSVPDHQIFIPLQRPRSNADKNGWYADGYLMMELPQREFCHIHIINFSDVWQTPTFVWTMLRILEVFQNTAYFKSLDVLFKIYEMWWFFKEP